MNLPQVSRVRLAAIGLLVSPCVLTVVLGCEDEPPLVAISSKGMGPQGAGNTVAAASPSASGTADEESLSPPKVEFQEEDFVETERSRDPFRSFNDLFVERPSDPTASKPAVILEDYALDELKLIGIITRIHPAKAMLVDPSGIGFVVHRNDLVGKAERVQSGAGNAEYEINWRVDRIRDADVVFVREDPSNPDVPSSTRVIQLHPDETK